jgi:large conductance mechanosensitive channel
MWKEFKEFAFKGNMIDMAVGIIIGGAFGLVVKSLATNVITPAISGLFQVPDFSRLFIPLDGNHYASLADLDKAGAPAIKYGVFLNDFINLMLVAFALFILVNNVVRAILPEPDAPPPPPPRQETLLEEIRDLLKQASAAPPNDLT